MRSIFLLVFAGIAVNACFCNESIFRKNETDDLVDARVSCMNETDSIENSTAKNLTTEIESLKKELRMALFDRD